MEVPPWPQQQRSCQENLTLSKPTHLQPNSQCYPNIWDIICKHLQILINTKVFYERVHHVLLTKLRCCAVALLRVALRCSKATCRGCDQECAERWWGLCGCSPACSQRRSIPPCTNRGQNYFLCMLLNICVHFIYIIRSWMKCTVLYLYCISFNLSWSYWTAET